MQWKYAKYAVLYAKYAEVYILHILHVYALPFFRWCVDRRRTASSSISFPTWLDISNSIIIIITQGSIYLRRVLPDVIRRHQIDTLSKTPIMWTCDSCAEARTGVSYQQHYFADSLKLAAACLAQHVSLVALSWPMTLLGLIPKGAEAFHSFRPFCMAQLSPSVDWHAHTFILLHSLIVSIIFSLSNFVSGNLAPSSYANRVLALYWRSIFHYFESTQHMESGQGPELGHISSLLAHWHGQWL